MLCAKPCCFRGGHGADEPDDEIEMPSIQRGDDEMEDEMQENLVAGSDGADPAAAGTEKELKEI